jgi:hypothetical protein
MQGNWEEFLCEKYRGSELLKSLRRKECTGNRSLNQKNLRRNNTLESVIEIQEPIPWKKQRPSLRRLQKYSESEVSESLGGGTRDPASRWIKWSYKEVSDGEEI